MVSLILSSAFIASGLVTAQTILDPALTGTWSSKSQSTETGPNFYDPVNEKLFEPDHTGISYSFTDDGHYEEAYYRAIANPVDPACPSGVMQWQHGSYEKLTNGSLILTPISVDGRQLTSDPCAYGSSILTRYNQSELFLRYEVITDTFYNIQRLNLYQFNGAPMMPLYFMQKTPKMLPTTTLNPTTHKHTAAASATGHSRSKRDTTDSPLDLPLNHRVIDRRNDPAGVDRWWWLGVAMTGFGGFLYFCF